MERKAKAVDDYLDDMLMYADIGRKVEFDQLANGFKDLVESELGKKHPLFGTYMEMRAKLEKSFNAQSTEWKESCRRAVYDFLHRDSGMT